MDYPVEFIRWLEWQAKLLDSQTRFEPIEFVFSKWTMHRGVRAQPALSR